MDKRTLLLKIIADFKQGDGLWELAIVAVCGILSYLIYRLVRAYIVSAKPKAILRPVVTKLAFPVALLVLLGVAALLISYFPNTIGKTINSTGNIIALFSGLATVWLFLRIFFVLLFVAFQRAYWVHMVMRVVEIAVWISVIFKIFGVFEVISNQLSSLSFLPNSQGLNFDLLAQAILIITLTLLFTLAISAIIERKLRDNRAIAPNFQIVLGRSIKALLVTIGILFSLSWVGFPLTSLSIFGGALGVGLGFGLQKIMSNYVSGFIILTDRSVKIGDFVTVDGFFGQVTQITTRYMLIQGVDGTEAIVPNETVLTSVVENHTCSDNLLMLSTSVSIDYGSDIGLAMKLISEAIKQERRVLKEPAPSVFFKEFSENALVLQAFFWIGDLEAGRLSLISRVNLTILELFQEHGIEIALQKHIIQTKDTSTVPAAVVKP